MKQFLLKLFTWWNGQTFGTQLWTWRFGELVGEDEQGNRYYPHQGRKIDPTLGFERRWVIYNGLPRRPACRRHGMAGCITPSTSRRPKRPIRRANGKSRISPNMTGTPAAYRPSGSTLASGRRPAATGDYQPWTPGS